MVGENSPACSVVSMLPLYALAAGARSKEIAWLLRTGGRWFAAKHAPLASGITLDVPRPFFAHASADYHVCMAPRRVNFVRKQYTCSMQSCHAKKNSRAMYHSFVSSPRTIPPKISSRGQNFSQGRFIRYLSLQPPYGMRNVIVIRENRVKGPFL